MPSLVSGVHLVHDPGQLAPNRTDAFHFPYNNHEHEQHEPLVSELQLSCIRPTMSSIEASIARLYCHKSYTTIGFFLSRQGN
jgi:hypothetical protein